MAAALVAALLLASAAWQPGHGARVGESLSPMARSADSPSVKRRRVDFSKLNVDVARSVTSFVPCPLQVAWSTGGCDISLLRLCSGEPRRALRSNMTAIVELKFSQAGGLLVTAHADGRSAVWETRTGQALHTWTVGASTEVFDVQVFPRGDRVVTLSSARRLVIWCAATGEMLQHFEAVGFDEHRSVRVLEDGAKLVTGVSLSIGDPAVIWDVALSRSDRWLMHGQDIIYLLEASPCGSRVVTAGYDDVFVWHADGRLEQRMAVVEGWTSDVAISSGGERVVGSKHGRVLVWDGRTGLRSQDIGTGTGYARFVLFPEGDRLFAVGPSSAAIWDLGIGAEVVNITDGLGGEVEHISMSPGGTVIAACGTHHMGTDGAAWNWVSAWDAATGRLLHQAWHLLPAGEAAWQCAVALGPPDSMATIIAAHRRDVAGEPTPAEKPAREAPT